jgi:hypothetical protein
MPGQAGHDKKKRRKNGREMAGNGDGKHKRKRGEI